MLVAGLKKIALIKIVNIIQGKNIMRIEISTTADEKNIYVDKEYVDVKDKGQVAQFIVELEFIKQELLEMWLEMSEDEKGGFSVEYDE